MPVGKGRIEFTTEHDIYLYKYLAVYCPTKEGRSGRKVYQDLVADENRDNWPWAVHHSWQSWRERYVRNSEQFDQRILIYQRKRSTVTTGSRKRPAESMPAELPKQSAKRVKREEEESSESETRADVQHQNAGLSQSQSVAKSLPQRHRESPETPLQVPQGTQSTTVDATTRHENVGLPLLNSTEKSLPDRPPEPEETPSKPPSSTRPTSAPRTDATSPFWHNASTSATKRTRDDVLEIPSSSPDRRVPFTTGPRSPSRYVKRIKVRRNTSPDIFVSGPSSPRANASAPASVEGRPPPVPASVQPRAPPRVVDSLHGQVLVDREGHVPRALPPGEKPMVEEEEEEQSKIEWPPVRGRSTKRKHTSGPDVKADAHHAFSQLQSPPRLEIPPQAAGGGEREQAKPMFDRRAVADLFAGPTRHFPQGESVPREEVARNGASPVKRVITAAPPSDPFSGSIPKPFAKSLKFPAPRPSTRSPFRPGPPSKQAARPPPRTRVARHPELTRVRRQTIANDNGREREHRREVPSVDLVTLSRTSTSVSARSHSRSSAGTSVPARPPRWSLPAFAQATPWVFDAPPLAHSDPWHTRAQSSSLVGTSTPRFMLTPSPARSMGGTSGVTLAPTNGPIAHSVSGIAPHPPDVALTASHGLASILTHMSANHGLALGVVEAVYERVGSLKEADEVLRGMREAAEGFGEREIERRLRARRSSGEGSGAGRMERGGGRKRIGDRRGRTGLRYVLASEDGEGSEYSPPETSRAAMWKRQSESSYVEEEGDEEEGREVEEELRNLDENEDDSGDETHHDFSRHAPLVGEDDEDTSQDRNDDGEQDVPRHRGTAWEEQKLTALLEDTRTAQEVERKLGKGRYRKDIARLFS